MAAGGNLTGAIALSEDLEKDNGIEDAGEQGVDSESEAESGPDVPMGIGGAGARRNDSGLDLFLRKAVIMVESMDGVGVHICQD